MKIFSIKSPSKRGIPLTINIILNLSKQDFIIVLLKYSITLWRFCRCYRYFYIKIFAKVCELFRNKLSPIITKYFWWTAKNTNLVLKKVLNNNSTAFAFNNGGITKSGEFASYMKVLNIFFKTTKIYCNSVKECCCSW